MTERILTTPVTFRPFADHPGGTEPSSTEPLAERAGYLQGQFLPTNSISALTLPETHRTGAAHPMMTWRRCSRTGSNTRDTGCRKGEESNPMDDGVALQDQAPPYRQSADEVLAAL